ncbi:MAG: YigZ family protein [Bacteroidales bacterium]|jgi:uncharacterized YigZ family protein|nr:YigZ family protein [Bacteroidales bacterium]
MSDIYQTLQGSASGIYKEKGSRFLAFAFPIENEEEAKEHLAQLKKQFFDAKHHCYAYVTGFDGSQVRMSDDGEPSYTAGKPIYGQIIANHLTNILIVVVRYFGGTKLGVGGLLQAYKTAAADCLSNAVIVEKNITERCFISFNYADMNAVMKVLKDGNIKTEKHNFDMQCSLEFSVSRSVATALLNKLTAAANSLSVTLL